MSRRRSQWSRCVRGNGRVHWQHVHPLLESCGLRVHWRSHFHPWWLRNLEVSAQPRKPRHSSTAGGRAWSDLLISRLPRTTPEPLKPRHRSTACGKARSARWFQDGITGTALKHTTSLFTTVDAIWSQPSTSSRLESHSEVHQELLRSRGHALKHRKSFLATVDLIYCHHSTSWCPWSCSKIIQELPRNCGLDLRPSKGFLRAADSIWSYPNTFSSLWIHAGAHQRVLRSRGAGEEPFKDPVYVLELAVWEALVNYSSITPRLIVIKPSDERTRLEASFTSLK